VLDALEPLLGTEQVTGSKTAVRGALDLTRAALEALAADPNAAFDRLQPSIEKLHAAIIRFEDLLHNTNAVAQHQFSRWDATLASAPLPAEESWRDWTKRGRESAELVGGAGAAPENLPQIETRLTSLFRDLKTVLLDQLQAESRPTIEALLAAGKYAEAVAALPGLIAAARRRVLEDREGSTPLGAAVPVTMPSPLLLPAPSAPPPVAYTVPASAAPTMVPVAVFAAMSHRALQGAGIALSSIYAAVIAAGGYFLFADKWIGTPLDFATVFFWAYATDIGADAATAAVRGLKQS
jgi:hypothetical protein